MRRYVVPALLAIPSLLAVLAYGCGDSSPPIEDLCGWLEDPHNCYRVFGQDIQQNGPFQCTQLSGTTNAVPQIGEFQDRNMLGVCILREGGLINFTAPVDLTKLPPADVAFTFVNTDMTECGSVDWIAPNNFSMKITGARIDDAGAPAKVGVQGGTFKIEPTGMQSSRATETVTCPTGESHFFDTLEVGKCTQYQDLQPLALLDIIPGGLDQDGNPGGNFGAIEFTLFTPPPNGDLFNAKSTQTKYFTCLFPGAPPLCANGVQDPGETDIDCGGTFCTDRCSDKQKCINNSDCISNVCTPVKGLKQCIGGGATTASGGGGGAGGAGGGGGAGGAGTTSSTGAGS